MASVSTAGSTCPVQNTMLVFCARSAVDCIGARRVGGVRMVVGEAFDMVVQRMNPSRGDHADLAETTTEHLPVLAGC